MAREVEDIAYRRGSKRVDGLRVISDNCEASAVWLEGQQDRSLQSVGVLLFIDQNVIEAGRHVGRKQGLRHHLRPIEQ